MNSADAGAHLLSSRRFPHLQPQAQRGASCSSCRRVQYQHRASKVATITFSPICFAHERVIAALKSVWWDQLRPFRNADHASLRITLKKLCIYIYPRVSFPPSIFLQFRQCDQRTKGEEAVYIYINIMSNSSETIWLQPIITEQIARVKMETNRTVLISTHFLLVYLYKKIRKICMVNKSLREINATKARISYTASNVFKDNYCHHKPSSLLECVTSTHASHSIQNRPEGLSIFIWTHIRSLQFSVLNESRPVY